MDDICTYQIQVRGQVGAGDIESFCPPGLSIETSGGSNTLLIFQADQSGMIGLIRHLHGLGLILLSVNCITTD